MTDDRTPTEVVREVLQGGVANAGAVVRVGDEVQRVEMLECLDETIERGGEFVKRHVDAGEPGFVEMWEQMGGMARFDRRRAWWAGVRPAFAEALH